jgi:hypothetical protein
VSTQNRNAGFIIAAIGGLVGLIAFFAMPFLSAYSFVSVTAQQLVSLEQQYFSSSSNSGQALIILWLAPVLSGIAILLAALQFRARPSSKRAAGGWLIALGILGVGLYVGILVYINSLITGSSSSSTNAPSLFSFLGAGYWVYIVAMAGVIVGGAMGLSAARSAPAVIAVPPPSYPSYGQPPTQYPPYQQPPPQYPPNQQQPWSQPPEYPPPPNQPGSSQWPPSQPN